MADEASDTLGGAFRNYLGSLGFILPLVGVEELVRHFVDTQHPSLPVWASVTLIIVGLPLFLLPWAWNKFGFSQSGGPRLHRRRLAIAQVLDDLYAEGVGHRNRLIPTIAEFDDQSERAKLVEWSNRVLAQCDDQHVAMREKSAFRTLNLFQPKCHDAEGKTEQQKKLEAMWTEKLDRLHVIIRKVGS